MNLLYSKNTGWKKNLTLLAKSQKFQEKAIKVGYLGSLTEPGNLRRLLEDYLKTLDEFSQPQTSSYYHDNGFHKIVLYSDPKTKMKLRLHVWDQIHGIRPEQNVHNHRWDYVSAVLMGEFTHNKLNLVKGNNYYHYRYTARGEKGHYDLEFMGNCSVRIYQSGHMKMGTVYHLGNEILHRIDTPSEITVATLILTQELSGWTTNDLITQKRFPNIKNHRGEIKSPPYSNRQLFDLVKRFMFQKGL